MLYSLRAGSPCAEMRACNNHGGNSIMGVVPIGGDCQINKMQNKLNYAEEQQI